MISPVACLECGKPFRVDKLQHCPSCGVVNVRLGAPVQQTQIQPSQQSTSTPQQFTPAPIASSDKGPADLIAAQDRTTHAVRSLAITFVAAPVISLIVTVAFILAAQTGNIGIIIVSGIFAVVILIATLVSALNELSMSKVHSRR